MSMTIDYDIIYAPLPDSLDLSTLLSPTISVFMDLCHVWLPLASYQPTPAPAIIGRKGGQSIGICNTCPNNLN